MAFLFLHGSAEAQTPPTCARTIKADVVAFDQPLMFNRLGAGEPAGMIYALRSDVAPRTRGTALGPGNVMLRPTKRPRPIVLRANEGDCLQITFTNYLSSPQPALPQQQPAPPTPTLNGAGQPQMNGLQVPGGGTDSVPSQTRTMYAGVSVLGLELVKPGDGTYVGVNQSSLVGPGAPSITYTYYAAHEGTNVLYSGGSMDATDPSPGTTQQTPGLFGAVTVEPQGSVWFRSQLSQSDMAAVSTPNANPALPPTMNYSAKYPNNGPYVLRMLDDNNNLLYSDLTAVVSGPIVAGQPTALPKQYPPNPALPNRQQPFREFTILYHEDQTAVQAFAAFNTPAGLTANNPVPISKVLMNSADVFAINYGTGGISAEVLANRLGTGPAKKCQECKFEEFFLSSWAQGDPAALVDKPANTNQPATKVFYPDDPSNVYHSYLNDHVRFRVLHAGQQIHHVHHLHAHQWLYEANDSNSAYLDSQSIGPGSSYTMEIAYNGSGNLNRTVGDSIFHCHFYPHFASGMWALWRVHDVFEAGTLLDGNGIPRAGSRALPDSEIATGTPIPGILPLPTLAMAPLPAAVTISGGQVTSVGAGNPGYPFFIPGLAGHRPPHPPLDFAVDQGKELNGGLPRHVVKSGNGQVHEIHTYQDFSKELQKLDAVRLPEDGTPVEQAAMAFHAQAQHASITPGGTAASFLTNGLPPAQGAPFADPCMTLNGLKPAIVRYKGADLQTDVTINKKGWHVPQQRMIALWRDVAPTISKQRAPEPLFFRANSQESCIEFWSTNLIPGNYALDDYQVRTPTDILGQHIHLVKFDVTSSDGSANGWNYEDGTFSPDEVRERITAINSYTSNKGLPWYNNLNSYTPVAPVAAPPVFGPAPAGQNWSGAQTTIQRWFADPVLNNQNQDRTLRTVFTHDHFGPSTHQQVGVYAGLLVEPKGSTWKSAVDGKAMHTRDDGGPTSFQAYIQTPGQAPYREFALEFQDVQLAYQAGTPVVGNGTTALAAPGGNAFNVYPTTTQPFPQIVSQNSGTASVNYRSEPLPYRTNANGGATGNATDTAYAFASIARNDPQLNWQHVTGTQPPSNGGTAYYPALTPGVGNYDPYTPLLRAYQGEKVQVRLLVGAHVVPHSFHLHGMPWLFEPSNANSGYRSQQTMGISEHFEMLLDVPRTPAAQNDYLWQTDAKIQGLSSGSWGLLRAYQSAQSGMYPTTPPAGATPTQAGCPGSTAPPQVSSAPSAPGPGNIPAGMKVTCLQGPNTLNSSTTCPVVQYQGLTWWALSYNDNRVDMAIVGYASPNGPPVAQIAKPGARYVYKITVDSSAKTVTFWGQSDRKVTTSWAEMQAPPDYRVTAISAADALATGSGSSTVPGKVTYFDQQGFQIFDSDALLYVMDDDLAPQSDGTYRLKQGAPVEPLVLRARAGQCLRVQLTNRFRPTQNVFTQAINDPTGGAFSRGPSGNKHPTVTMPNISANVGFHAQLVAYDMQTSDGANVGMNPVQTVAPNGASRIYTWYAGKTSVDSYGNLTGTPVEFGAINLLPADPLGQPMHGLAAALIVEPAGATWQTDPGTRVQAMVTPPSGTAFREFVAIDQDSLVLQDNLNIKIDPTQKDPEDSDSSRSFNYGTAPMTDLYGFNIVTANSLPDLIDYSCGESDSLAMVWRCNAKGTCHWASTEPVGAAKTPIFTAQPGVPVRFRMLKGYAGNPPGSSTGGASDDVITIQGHNWQDEPYVNNSTAIGTNPLSSWTGNRMGYVSASHFDMVIPSAGGPFRTPSDYWVRSYEQNSWMFGGTVGLFRVGTPPTGAAQPPCAAPSAKQLATLKKAPVRPTQNQIERALLLRSKSVPEGPPSPRLLKLLQPAKRTP